MAICETFCFHEELREGPFMHPLLGFSRVGTRPSFECSSCYESFGNSYTWTFPKLGVPFGGTYNQDYRIFGCVCVNVKM